VAHLVTSRDGNRVLYRLAGPDVAEFLGQFQRFGEARLAELRPVVEVELGHVAELDPVSLEELEARLEDPATVIVDVRPVTEFRSGHVPGAISVPLEELAGRLFELPPNVDVIAYCRGPFA
jgi:3-mercaptopyruvate sulfurtransferase SseA